MLSAKEKRKQKTGLVRKNQIIYSKISFVVTPHILRKGNQGFRTITFLHPISEQRGNWQLTLISEVLRFANSLLGKWNKMTWYKVIYILYMSLIIQKKIHPHVNTSTKSQII